MSSGGMFAFCDERILERRVDRGGPACHTDLGRVAPGNGALRLFARQPATQSRQGIAWDALTSMLSLNGLHGRWA